MSDKRRGLGRGIGALIPSHGEVPAGVGGRDRPVDVFFPSSRAGAARTAPPSVRGESPSGSTPPAEDAGGDAGRDSGLDDGQVDDLTVTSGEQTADVSRETPSDDRSSAGTTALVPVPGARFADLPLAEIRPNSRQPRQVFEQDAMAELVHSIQEIGVLQPVVVRPLEATDADGARYELIMGERRWRASGEAGLTTVPAIVRATDDDDMLRDALLENLHRSELNPLEEASAYQQLLEDFGCTQDELSRRIGRSRPQISNTIRLLRLPPAVQRRVAAGVLSAGHARALLALSDPAEVEILAHRIVSEGLSVRAVEEIVASGGVRSVRPAPPRAGARLPLLDQVATRLSDRLDTRVKVALGRNRGRLTVEFASVDDLDRILDVLDPGGPGVNGRERTVRHDDDAPGGWPVSGRLDPPAV